MGTFSGGFSANASISERNVGSDGNLTYTAPSDGYAIVSIGSSLGLNSADTLVTLDGSDVGDAFGSLDYASGIYVGPSSTIRVDLNSAGDSFIYGTEFKNAGA